MEENFLTGNLLFDFFKKHPFLKKLDEELIHELIPFTQTLRLNSREQKNLTDYGERFYIFLVQGKISVIQSGYEPVDIGSRQIFFPSLFFKYSVLSIEILAKLPSELAIISFNNTAHALHKETKLLQALANWYAIIPEASIKDSEANGDGDIIRMVHRLKLTQKHLFSIFHHDLRNPIATLISLLDLCIHEFEAENYSAVKALLQDIQTIAYTNLYMLDNLKKWAELRAGLTNPLIKSVSVSLLFKKAHESVLPNYLEKSISLVIELSEDMHILGDENFAFEAIKKLLLNACKFSYRGQQVKLTANRSNGQIEIRVIDEGKGMKESTLAQLFKPGKSKTDFGTENEMGGGLGLLIVKDMMDLMNGSIEASSESGKGSIFTLVFQEAKSE